ncbi:MAG: hypothetical protein D6732_11180 [Methanobacteriota archaeon]|nr:MAG: hypothetical protein D6732_11180 [Euryarchaeota archaeon]
MSARKLFSLLLIVAMGLSFANHGTVSNPSGTNLIITEVLYDTPGCDSTCEWVEIFNPTSTSISVAGWTLEDNTKGNALPSVTIPSGGYLVLARDNAGFQSLYGFLPDGLITLALGNSGDQLTLKDDAGTVVDFVAWESYVTGWSASAVDGTIHRLSDSSQMPIDTDTGSDWADSGSLGTPGSGYGVGDITAPVVSIDSPTSSVVAGQVQVTCSATDNVGVTGYSIKIDGVERTQSSSYLWDTTLESSGLHTITCDAFDAAGNVGTTSKDVTVDNSPVSDLIKVYFTDPLAAVPTMENLYPGNISDGLVSLLDSANVSVDAALYHLSWQPAIDALINAHLRGVQVRVAAHGDNIGEFQPLIDAGISVTAVTTTNIMHNKFFIVDGEYVFTGSWNPTDTGTLFNANDAVRIKSTELAGIYQAEFDQLFANTYGTSKVDNNAEIAMAGSIQVEAYFSPKDTGLTRLIELIDSSNSSIYLSLFYLTENSIYDAIVRARDRGVAIVGVFDYRGWRNAYSEADDVISWGGGVVDANPGVYHHKFGVFDGSIVWTGSTNWSGSGFNSNDENALVIHSPTIAAHYIARVNAYKQDADNYDSDPLAAPRIVTRHYSGYPGENFITWRPHLNGNTPSDLVKSYLVWKWNDTASTWDLMQEVNWAVGYATDSNVVIGTTYYYCVSAVTWDGQTSGCSAEFAERQNADGSDTQPVLYPATGHLSAWGTELEAPSLSFIGLVDGQTVSGFVSIGLDGNDRSLIKDWEIRIDGVAVSYSSFYVWDSRSASAGSHTIAAIATDMFGNSITTSVTVNVDNSAFGGVAPLDYSAVKFMTYNIEASGQNPGYIDVIKEENPDVLLLVETGDMDDRGNATINRLLVDLNTYFSNELPYLQAMTLGQGSMYTGLAVLSRVPILSAKLIPLVTLDSGSLYDVSHDFIDVKLAIGTGTVHFIGAHLKASSGTTNENKRERAQEGIINYMDSLGSSANIIYAGDLNSFSPQDTGALAPNGNLGYGPMTMLVDPANATYGQYSSTVHTFTDVFRTLNPTDPGYTYYTSPYESRIDFMVVNGYLAGQMLSSTVGDTPSATGASDHYSVDGIFDLSAWAPTDTTPPGQVQGLTANAVSSSQIDLTWTANTEPDLDHYNVYRDGVLVASVSTSSYSDVGLSAGTSYSYEVSAVDMSGNEGLRSIATNATTPAAGLDHIIISEVFYDTPGKDSVEEWIELYNPTGSSVDLTGWTISDNSRTYSIASGTVIPAGGFLVIARSTSGFFALYGFNPDFGDLNLALGNSGDMLSLKDASGIEIDFVAWENYVAGWSISASTGQSLARIDLTVDTDGPSDWQAVSSNGAPGVAFVLKREEI